MALECPTPYRIDRETDALLLVDCQTAFMPEHWRFPAGGLPVKQGNLVILAYWRIARRFAKRFATLDRHPAGHVSLASSYVGLSPYSELTLEKIFDWTETENGLAPAAGFSLTELREYLRVVVRQTLWPDHALVGSPESELHPFAAAEPCEYVQVKGLDPACDSYSAFFDNRRRPTGLADVLKERGVKRLFVCGLAYDFCVGWTALDAASLGFATHVVIDATRPVDLPGTVETMDEQLARAGIPRVECLDLERG